MSAAEMTLPFGNAKGTALSQADEQALTWTFGAVRKKLVEDPNKPYADKDRRLLAGIKAQLVQRFAHDGATLEIPAPGSNPTATPATQAQQRTQPRAPTTALARSQDQQLVTARDANVINQRLADFAKEFHLVTPATSCASLPEGCEVSFSIISVDTNTGKDGPGDVAPVGGGKLSLSANVLKRIAGAAGVDWDTERSGRLDDGRERLYVHYRAVGVVRNFDGSTRRVSGEVELDLRDGSPQVDAMYERSSANVDAQLRDMRLFILRHAETKAKSRAIADMGVRRSYTAAELSKPFAVAKLMFTGRTDDPELKRIFAKKMADAHMASVRGMYGGPASLPPRATVGALPERRPAQAEPIAPPAHVGHAAPAVGSVPAQADDDYGDMDQPYGDEEMTQ